MVARGTQKPHFSQKKRETGTPDVGRLLQLAPDVFEIVEAFFARLPFGSADGAFGEAAAGFGVVAEVDAVGRRFEDDFVQADYIAFAEGCDLDIFSVATGLADHLLECNRVAVEDGHTESVSIRLKTKAKREEIIAAWNSYRAEPQDLKLPSAPERPVVYLEANDRPQPRFDIDMGAGMTTAVGRLRPCGVLDWKFTVLSHNTIRGAAGAAVLNAELLKAKGYLGEEHEG